MKRQHIDAALISLCVLFAVAGILGSARAVEQVGVVLLVTVLSVATIVVGSLLIGYRRFTQRAALPALTAPVVCLAVLISVAATHWPLRVTYALSRDAFDAVAQRVRTGKHINTPVHVGLFTIRSAGLSSDGIVCLWTHPKSRGSIGFVQCRRDYVPFSLWSIVRLDDRWQFIAED